MADMPPRLSLIEREKALDAERVRRRTVIEVERVALLDLTQNLPYSDALPRALRGCSAAEAEILAAFNAREANA